MSTYFDGKGTRARVVRMGGASGHAESAAAVVERARRERAQRREQQARTAAATRIAAFYRGRSTARAVCAQLRAACDAQLAACLAPTAVVQAPQVAAVAAPLAFCGAWAHDLERAVKAAVVLARCVRARTLFSSAHAVPHGGFARFRCLLARLAAFFATIVAEPAARLAPAGGLVLWAARCLASEQELAAAVAPKGEDDNGEDVASVSKLAREFIAVRPGFFSAMQDFFASVAAAPEAFVESAAAVVCAAACATPAAARAFITTVGAHVNFAAVPVAPARHALAARLATCLAEVHNADKEEEEDWAAGLTAPAVFTVLQNVLPVLAASADAQPSPALIGAVLVALDVAGQRLEDAPRCALADDVLAQVGAAPVLLALARRATELWQGGAGETRRGRGLFVFLGAACAGACDRRVPVSVRHTLATGSDVVPVLWAAWTERGRLAAVARDPTSALPRTLTRVLGVWAGCCLAALAPLDDDDFASGLLFFPLPDLARMVPILLRLVWQWYSNGEEEGAMTAAGTRRKGMNMSSNNSNDSNDDDRIKVFEGDLGTVQKLLSHLYDRDTRLHFCPAQLWLMPCAGDVSSAFVRALPFVVPLEARIAWFRTQLRGARTGAEHRVRVRRQHAAEDAYAQLAPLGAAALAGRVRVTFVDDATGLDEAGIDGGGLFRDLMTRLVRAVFAPEHGLFARTPTGTLAPSPRATAAVRDWPARYRFAGALLGKCLLEGILIEVPLAPCFLRRVLGRQGACAPLADLAALDPVLARNLARLKTTFVEDLTFSIVEVDPIPDTGASTDPVLSASTSTSSSTSSSGNKSTTRIVELIPHGAERAVTPENRLAYIALLADYRVNRQTRAQTAAFAAGLAALVRPALLALFSPAELQYVVSGAPGGIDVADWEAHTAYSPPAARLRPCVRWFWATLRALAPRQQADVLLFATGCSRPPLLGFAHMAPPFALAVVAADRWPTAATCMNLLRIPDESSPDRLRQKLLDATSVDNGFFLS